MLDHLFDYLFTPRIINYGMSDIVRTWCKYPKWLPFRFNIHHGWYPADDPRDGDLRNRSPAMLVFNKRQKIAWDKKSKKIAIIVGAPFIHYRRMVGIKKDINASGTVAFPHHCGTVTKPEFDLNEYCEALKGLPNAFHPITICLHWDDIKNGRDSIYIKHGFRVVTAGHRHHSDFVHNFYSILRQHKFSTSNAIGSNVFYSVELGIPFFLYGAEAKQNYPILPSKTMITARQIFNQNLNSIEINESQKKFVNEEMGLNDFLQPHLLKQQLLSIFFLKSIPHACIRLLQMPWLIIKKIFKTFTFRHVSY